MKARFLSLATRIKDPICLIAFAQLFIHCIHLSFLPFFILFLQSRNYPIETVSSLVLVRELGKYQAFGNLRSFLAAPISALFGKLFIGYKSFYFFSYFLLTLLSIPLFYFMKKRKQLIEE